jgi:hypothetical protein
MVIVAGRLDRAVGGDAEEEEEDDENAAGSAAAEKDGDEDDGGGGTPLSLSVAGKRSACSSAGAVVRRMATTAEAQQWAVEGRGNGRPAGVVPGETERERDKESVTGGFEIGTTQQNEATTVLVIDSARNMAPGRPATGLPSVSVTTTRRGASLRLRCCSAETRRAALTAGAPALSSSCRFD